MELDEITSELKREQKEELANSITHGFGLLLCIVALPVLVYCTAARGGAWNILSVAIFSLSLLMVYASSTIYHSISFPPLKSKLRILDHICIYFLIAGSYTPFIVISVKEGAWLLVLLWIFVIVGIIFKVLVQIDKGEVISLITYVVMSWLGVIYAYELWINLPSPSFALLLGGGISYTVGVVFYMWDKLMYNHAIWHLFVMAGSAAHVAALMVKVNLG